jgi:hypothetical protein
MEHFREPQAKLYLRSMRGQIPAGYDFDQTQAFVSCLAQLLFLVFRTIRRPMAARSQAFRCLAQFRPTYLSSSTS